MAEARASVMRSHRLVEFSEFAGTFPEGILKRDSLSVGFEESDFPGAAVHVDEEEVSHRGGPFR